MTFEISSHFEDKYVYCVVHVAIKTLFSFVTFIHTYIHIRTHTHAHNHTQVKILKFLERSRNQIHEQLIQHWSAKFITSEIQVFLMKTSDLIKILSKLREMNWHTVFALSKQNYCTRWGSSFLEKFHASSQKCFKGFA